MQPIIIAPDDAVLVDERVSITIKHLQPLQRCTIRAELRSEKNQIFESFGQFIGNSSGEVNLEKDSSFGGTYVGSDGMGLFWSMVPAPGQRKGLRYTVRNLHTPMKFRLQLFDGHIQPHNGEDDDGKILATKTILRTYLSPDVERHEVHVGRIRGTLFVPKQKAKFPGVIDIFGSHGGLLEFRAALLASHGFAVFALAFSNYDGLPSELQEVELEYFLEAVDWLSKHERVSPDGIGFIGVSYGGQIAMQAAAECGKIKAVVAINSPYVVYFMKFKNEMIGCGASVRIEGCEVIDGGVASVGYFDQRHEELENHAIEVERIQGKLMLITGQDDMSVRSSLFADKIKDRVFNKTGRDVIHLSYPQAGHLIEPPYMPLCTVSFHKIFNCVYHWGGKVVEHNAAQVHAWKSVISFLKQNLVQIPPSKI